MTKFITTLKFKKNIKKYNLIVFLGFNIAIFADSHIDSNTHLLCKTIGYLEYENKILIINHKKNIIKNI